MSPHDPSLFPRSPLLDGHDAEATRRVIIDYFNHTFDRYESLFETLASDEAYYRQPIPLRHPLIFYLGHTATFFTNKLLLSKLISQRVDAELEAMLSVGVDEMSWDDLGQSNYDWPSVARVRHYRDQVRAMVNQVMADTPLILPVGWDNPWWIIMMGIEHERIHIETSSVLIRQHDLAMVRSQPAWRPFANNGQAPANTLVAIPAGATVLGKSREDSRYGWDNEYLAHQVQVAAFQASTYLVSNAEFAEFVADGGYRQDGWWTEEGLAWRQYARATRPTFWRGSEPEPRLRLLTEEIAMPWDWPAEVNYHEAKAFCAWKGAQLGVAVRLPSEDEWYRLYDSSGIQEVGTQQLADANLHLDHGASACPVNLFRHGELYDVVGNVWQWTETPIYPFPGFEVHPVYDDFTTPTFDGRHNLMKGGSFISCGNETLRSARYAFRRHFFQHAGFRYVVSETPPVSHNVYYESDRQLSEYAEFHFGDEYYGEANFSQSLAQLALTAMQGKPMRKALDLGCATGRLSFELAREFQHVTGIDFSARFINLAVQMAQQGEVRYTLVDEGELVSYRTRTLAELGLASTHDQQPVRDRVAFLQGDACNLKPQFTGYDLIVAANLIDRLYHPAQFLRDIHQRLNIGGVLLLASPYTWLEEHTERDNWLGGFKRDGENLTTLQALEQHLAPHFRLMQAPQDVPFVIRETRRKFQHTLSEATLWERIR